jgi:hypothetical protein
MKIPSMKFTLSTRRFVAVLSLFTAFSAHAAQPTPEVVANNFLKALINVDTTAMQFINDYQRSARQAAGYKDDFINVNDMVDADKTFPEDISQTFMQRLTISSAEKTKLQPAVVAFFRGLKDAQNRTNCTIGNANPTTTDAKGNVHVTVPFDCKVANPPEKILAFLARSAKNQWTSAEQYRDGLKTLQQGYETAPLTQVSSGTFPLVSNKSPIVWMNMFPRESLDIESLLY